MQTVLSGASEKEAIQWMKQAEAAARQATCQRSSCGSVIIKDGVVIGVGFNSPANECEKQRRCSYEKDALDRKVTDKTCCIHAEQRAILDALKHNATALAGSRLYFIRLNDVGDASFSGQPYCTICSKLALDSGVADFVLWHKEGITVYSTDEYNQLSYQYQS